MRKLIVTSFIACLYLQHTTVLAESLCSQSETIFFTCRVGSSGKILSVCGSLKGQEFLQYRFGHPKKIELSFPSIKIGSMEKFSWTQDYRKTAGTTEYALLFDIARYKYVVSATSYPLSEGNNAAFGKFGGVTISDKNGKKTEISCANEPTERLVTLGEHVAHE
jgi:hypothetical protein